MAGGTNGLGGGSRHVTVQRQSSQNVYNEVGNGESILAFNKRKSTVFKDVEVYYEVNPVEGS